MKKLVLSLAFMMTMLVAAIPMVAADGCACCKDTCKCCTTAAKCDCCTSCKCCNK